jgi:GTP-binding protein LepA
VELTSAKTGEGVLDVSDPLQLTVAAHSMRPCCLLQLLPSIVRNMPSPSGALDLPLRGLVFDSWFDTYRGAVSLVAVKDGAVKSGDKVVYMHTSKQYTVQEVAPFFSQ